MKAEVMDKNGSPEEGAKGGGITRKETLNVKKLVTSTQITGKPIQRKEVAFQTHMQIFLPIFIFASFLALCHVKGMFQSLQQK